MANEETIIQLKGMGKEFKTANGPVVALNDINLDIYRGEIFGIIGPVSYTHLDVYKRQLLFDEETEILL